jgi:hypothetical protein
VLLGRNKGVPICRLLEDAISVPTNYPGVVVGSAGGGTVDDATIKQATLLWCRVASALLCKTYSVEQPGPWGSATRIVIGLFSGMLKRVTRTTAGSVPATSARWTSFPTSK